MALFRSVMKEGPPKTCHCPTGSRQQSKNTELMIYNVPLVDFTLNLFNQVTNLRRKQILAVV